MLRRYKGRKGAQQELAEGWKRRRTCEMSVPCEVLALIKGMLATLCLNYSSCIYATSKPFPITT
jgi:hypothetical protein